MDEENQIILIPCPDTQELWDRVEMPGGFLINQEDEEGATCQNITYSQ